MSVIIASAIYWADWPNATDTAFEVRARSNRSWVSAESEIVPANESRVVGTGTITALRPTLPVITLPSTSAGLDDQTAKWTVTLHRVGKSQVVSTVLADFPLPSSFEPSVTWAQIKIHKNGKQPLRDTSVYTKTETDYQIALAMGNLNRAGVGVLGRIETATIPNDPLHPKAVLNEDPRVLDISNYASFAAMISAVGSTQYTFNIHGNINVTANATVPQNITLRFLQGGRLTLTTGVTLLIRGPIIADPIKIFYNAVSGEGTVAFAAGASYLDTINLVQRDLWVEWWGAKGDNDNANAAVNPPALEAAFTALPHGGTLRLAGRFYKIDRGVVWSHKFQGTVVGNESGVGYADNLTKPVLVYQGANGGTALTLSNMYSCTFKGFGVYSNDGANPSNGADRGIYLTHAPGGFPSLTSHCNLIAITSYAIHTRVNWIGIDINDGAGANNEHHTIEDAHIQGGETHTGTTQIGLRLGHPQVKAIVLRRSNISNVGIAVAVSGNLRAYDNTYVSCGTVYLGNYITEALSVYGDDVESVTYIFRGVQQPGPARVAFLGCRYANLYGAGTSAGTAIVQTVGSISFYDCFFGALNGGVFGPYFIVGPLDGNYPSAKFVNSTWQVGTIQSLAQGFATCSTVIEEGRETYRFGGSKFTERAEYASNPSGEDTPVTHALRRTLTLASSFGMTFAGKDGLSFGDESIGIGGLTSPTGLSLTVVGTGGVTLRRFTIYAVDAAGRRSLNYRDGDGFVSTLFANATLTASNRIELRWNAQRPTPDHFEVWEINPADSSQARFVADVTPSGTATEGYDVVANPSGSFAAFGAGWNEAGIINLRNSVVFPNEVTFADGDTTPSIATANDFVTANTGATSITTFDDGDYVGQQIRIRIGDANTTFVNGASLVTGTGANIVAVEGAIYTFMNRALAWRRIL